MSDELQSQTEHVEHNYLATCKTCERELEANTKFGRFGKKITHFLSTRHLRYFNDEYQRVFGTATMDLGELRDRLEEDDQE